MKKIIQPSELRVGNYIYDDFDEVHVVERVESQRYNDWNGSDPSLVVFSKPNDEYNSMYTCDIVSGIPLTEEWLVKLGAKEYMGEWQYGLHIGGIKLFFRKQSNIWYSELGGIYMGDRFKFVHEVQNIKFALTGNELTIS